MHVRNAVIASALFLFAACGSPVVGSSTGQGTMPAAAVPLDPATTALSMTNEGPAPFLSVPMRRRLTSTIKTEVMFCVDAGGAVVYTEIRKSSKNRDFDEQVRKYFAQSTFAPVKPDQRGQAQPVCTWSALSYKVTGSAPTGRSGGGLTTTRANSYVPDCAEFTVIDREIVCANETTRRHERIINN